MKPNKFASVCKIKTSVLIPDKELGLCHKFKFASPYIFAT